VSLNPSAVVNGKEGFGGECNGSGKGVTTRGIIIIIIIIIYETTYAVGRGLN